MAIRLFRDAGTLWPGLARAPSRRRAEPLVLRPVDPEDAVAVSVLQATVFDGPAEARLTMALRDRGALVAEMLAVSGGRLVAHAALAQMRAPAAWALLLPVTALPGTGRGPAYLAHRLAAAVLEEAGAAGCEMAVTTGDPEFGRRLGFVYGRPQCLTAPFASRFTGVKPLSADGALPCGPVGLRFPREVLAA